MTAVAASPAPPRRLLSGEFRETWTVSVDCVVVGTVECDRHGDWRWQLRGMTDSVPARLGLRMDAVEELVRAASLPSGWRHTDRGHRVPKALVIAKQADGEDGG